MDYASLPHTLSDSDADSSYEQQVEDLWPFYSIGRPDDVLVPRDKTCQEISDLLGRAHTLGQYSFGEAASTLPDVPGLALEGGGTVPLPLGKEVADKIVQRGYEERKKVWTVSPGLLSIKNPAWTVGFQSLLELSSRKLGFDEVVLQPELSKLMVVEAGGRINIVQGADNGRSVATLVVQLPSEYAGGDWVVHDEGTRKEFRYDLGKVDGTAAFKPHFLVFRAGASYAVEEVTSGYCVVLVYSLCLPLGMDLVDCRQDRSFVRTQLAEALKKLKGGPDDAELSGEMDTGKDEPADKQESVILALVLSKECKQTDIEAAGTDSLSGVDRDRLQILIEANALLPPGKQLVFYFARIWYEIHADDALEQKRVVQGESWFFTSGAKIDRDCPHGVEWTSAFHFLNPGNETLSELWASDGRDAYMRPARFALVGWPASTDIGNAVTLFGELPSVPVILSHRLISVTTLRKLLEPEDGGRSGYCGYSRFTQTFRKVEQCKGQVSLLPFCQKLGDAIIAVGDVTLAVALFHKYVVHLKEKERSLFIPWLQKLAQQFGWERLKTSIRGVIDVKSHEIRLNLALGLADMLSDIAPAQSDLVVFAIGKAKSWCSTRPEAFASSGTIVKLLKQVMACANTQILSLLVALLQNLNGKFLRPVIDAFLAGMDDSSLPEHFVALASVASRRRQWLAKEIEDSKNPFMWSIPVRDFPDGSAIEQFLRGTDATYEIRGFSCIAEARTRVDLLRQKILGSLQFVASGRGRDAFVQVIKAGGEFDERRKQVPTYEAEIERLDQLVKNLLPDDENLNTTNTSSSRSAVTPGHKRHREEESGVYE